MPSLNIVSRYTKQNPLAKFHISLCSNTHSEYERKKSTSINPTELNQKHKKKKTKNLHLLLILPFLLFSLYSSLYLHYTYISKCIVHCDVYLFAEKGQERHVYCLNREEKKYYPKGWSGDNIPFI